MAVITRPTTLPFTRITWTPPAQNQVNRSEWTGARKVVRLPGAGRWKVTAALLATTKPALAWPWMAFFADLEGAANTFYMPYCNGAQYVAPGTGATPTVASGQGNLQGARAMSLQGLGSSGLRMYAGEAISVTLPSGKKQMLVLTQNLVANGSGVGTATFRGALRETLAGGAAVEFRNPVCEVALTADVIPIPNSDGLYEFAFDAEEAF